MITAKGIRENYSNIYSIVYFITCIHKNQPLNLFLSAPLPPFNAEDILFNITFRFSVYKLLFLNNRNNNSSYRIICVLLISLYEAIS